MTYKSPCPLCLCGERNPSDLSGEPLIESNVSNFITPSTGGLQRAKESYEEGHAEVGGASVIHGEDRVLRTR